MVEECGTHPMWNENMLDDYGKLYRNVVQKHGGKVYEHIRTLVGIESRNLGRNGERNGRELAEAGGKSWKIICKKQIDKTNAYGDGDGERERECLLMRTDYVSNLRGGDPLKKYTSQDSGVQQRVSSDQHERIGVYWSHLAWSHDWHWWWGHLLRLSGLFFFVAGN